VCVGRTTSSRDVDDYNDVGEDQDDDDDGGDVARTNRERRYSRRGTKRIGEG